MTSVQGSGHKNITLPYSLIQCFYWMGFASISAFSSVYLLSLGISNTVIGNTLGLGALLSAIAQPFVGIMIDRRPNVTTKAVLCIGSTITIMTALLLFPASKGVPSLVPFMYVLLMFLLQLAQPFSNSIGMLGINAGYKLNFGLGRALGSLGYAFVAFILGRLSKQYGGNVVPLFIALSFIFTLISLLIYPVDEKARKMELSAQNAAAAGDSPTSTKSVNSSGLLSFFKKYSTFAISLIGLTLIFYSHVTLNSFGLQIIASKGGSNAEMGIATAISASIELIPMVLFPILVKKFRISSMLMISAAFFTLKILFTLLATNVPMYYAAQLCQLPGWGIMAISIVYYVNELVDETDSAQGQAYAGSTLTLGNVIGNLFGGRIIDALGINMLLTIGLISALIGTAIFCFGIIITDKQKKITVNS